MPGLAAEGDVLFLVALAHDLDDLAVDLVEVGVGAVGRLPLIELVEGLGDAGEGGVGGLEDLPLLQLDGVLLVDDLGVLVELIPVVLDAVVLLDKGDGVQQLLAGVGDGLLLGVLHGHGDRKVGQADAAALEHGGRLGGVAGHVGGEHHFTQNGEGVVQGHARLRRAAGADVGGQTEGLGHVDVVGLDMLVDVADDKLRQGLHGDGGQPLEALEEEGRDGLVEGDALVGLRAAAEARVVCQDEGDLLREVLHDAVHVHVGDAQLRAAVALKEPVDEHEGAQIGAHPAVLPEAFEDGQGGGGHHAGHGHQVLDPGAVVVERVLHAAPLAVFGHARLVVVAGPEAAGAVLGLPQRVEALELFVHGGKELVGHFHLTSLPESA